MSGKVRVYDGENIDIHYELQRCIHAAACVERLRAVFDNQRKPWIITDNASADQVADTIQHCPSGALNYRRKDGKPNETPQSQATIRAVDGGQLNIRGNLTLKIRGEKQKEMRLSLCRCGESQNKPFCDNSHQKINFQPQETAPYQEEPFGEQTELIIEPLTDGPVKVTGNVAIHSATDTPIYQGTKAFLCRCGHSSNKPFCDGTHRSIGFKAD